MCRCKGYLNEILPSAFPLDIITRMSLTFEEVEYIALLARLDLSLEEKQRYQQQLSDILEYVAQLQKLDTKNIMSTSSHLPSQARLRADVPKEGLSPERALENAPDLEADQFKVPPVLE